MIGIWLYVDIMPCILGDQVLQFSMILSSLILHLQTKIQFLWINKFTKLFQSSYLSPNIILSQVDIAAPEYFSIVDAIQNVIGYIYWNGDSRAMGWCKHGNINDRISVEHNNNNTDNHVNASEINYCIVQLIPINQKNLDSNHLLWIGLNQLKYDASLPHNANWLRLGLDWLGLDQSYIVTNILWVGFWRWFFYVCY